MIIKINNTEIPVEVFSSDEDIRKGLMHRIKPLGHSGALFDLGKPLTPGFWMKNTRIPLDIIFVSPDMRITNIKRSAKPNTLDLHFPKVPARYVIELDGGYSKTLGIKEGDRLKLLTDKEILRAKLSANSRNLSV